MSNRQRRNSGDADNDDFHRMLARDQTPRRQAQPQYHQGHGQQQQRLPAYHSMMNDLRHSSDADASSDFSSLSEMDSLQRDVLSGDYDSDQELPLGGRWDLAAHWHLIGDYSEGVEGDADDDDEEERDVDTDLSEGPAGPTTRSGIYLDLSRVHDILSSIPSSTPLDPSPSDSSMRASTLAGELAEAAVASVPVTGGFDSFSSTSEDLDARDLSSQHHYHQYHQRHHSLSPSARTVRFSRDAVPSHINSLSTSDVAPPSPIPDVPLPDAHTPRHHDDGGNDVRPDIYNGDMDDSQGGQDTARQGLQFMTGASNGVHAFETGPHLDVNSTSRGSDQTRTGSQQRLPALQHPISPSLGRDDRRNHYHPAVIVPRYGLLSSSLPSRRHLSPYWNALSRYPYPISSSSRSSVTSPSPASSTSSSRMASPGLEPMMPSGLKSPDGEESGGATAAEQAIDRSAAETHGEDQGQGRIVNDGGILRAAVASASAIPASTLNPTRHRRVIASNISSLPSFASSVFTPRIHGTEGGGPAGLHRSQRSNHPRRQCCFLQPGQKFQGTQNLETLTGSLPGLRSRQTEEWDVKVTITAVDYDAGAVYGLMEAMDVPMSSSNVVTFWEGEIIDFENHTFWTRKWTAKARTDVEHWKRLEAFQGLDERHIIRGAKTGKFRGHIDQKYIFMRWKEKHFVNISEHTSEHTSGLTIAGFYYLSMRRSDGFVEGYYHDQQSTPFQHLTLRPTFEATGFSSPVFEVA